MSVTAPHPTHPSILSPTSGVFLNAEEALHWATEVLRRRRVPHIASFWKEIVHEATEVSDIWEKSITSLHMPQDAETRFDLAMKVQQALADVALRDAEAAQLLFLWSWGDWADDVRLHKALSFQEHMRRQGIRVRIAYRYSYSQLGLLLRCHKKVAWRKVQKALTLLSESLTMRGLLLSVES